MIYLDASIIQNRVIYDITDWLKENVGPMTNTTHEWDGESGKGWSWFGPRDPEYLGDRKYRAKTCVYFIDDPKKEILFRLRWGQYEYR